MSQPNTADQPSRRGPSRYGLDPFEQVAEPAFHWEIRVVTGEEGRRLRAAQAAALREVLRCQRQQNTEQGAT